MKGGRKAERAFRMEGEEKRRLRFRRERNLRVGRSDRRKEMKKRERV